MITLPSLRYAAAVARHGSFTAAARECGVSQPTISNAVADLEETLGARIFERSTRKLAPTPAGERLLPLISAVIEASSDLEREAGLLKEPPRKLLRVGFSQLLGAQRLGLLFEPYARKEKVEIVYKECAHDDMESRLEANTVDVVCGVRLARSKNRGRQLLYREPLRFVPPSGVASGTRATLLDVARSRLVLTDGSCGLAPATRELFARAGVTIDEYAGRAISYAALEEWTELGIGGAILPESRIRRTKSAPLVHDDAPIHLAYEAVWRKDLLVAQHMETFVRYLRTVVPRLVRTIAGASS
jgi:LysR family transcriptional regulator, hydrogen peroxide-inducible genes activator